MADFTYNALFLGNFAAIDTNEGNQTNESEATLLGDHSVQAVALTARDTTNDGNIASDDLGASAEQFSYDRGFGTVSSPLDGEFAGNVVLTYADGTTSASHQYGVIQTANGDVFLIPPTTSGAAASALTAKQIQSIEIVSIANDSFNAVAANRQNLAFSTICFVAGTRIATPSGPVPVERLRPGDLVLTLDHGARPLAWVGTVRARAIGALAPVVFAPGAVGNDRPLALSPLHRVRISDWRAHLMFGAPEVLVTARALVNGTTIRRRVGGGVTYAHLLFDRHELVFAEGAVTESLHPGAQAMETLDDASRDEVLALFPALRSDPAAFGPPARPGLRGFEERALGALRDPAAPPP